MDISESKYSGEAFESQIAELYALLGYHVQRHVPVCGQEVDILAKKPIAGGGQFTVMVECKFKGSRTLAGNADVQSIAGAFAIARGRNLVSSCAIVTTNGFSLNAQRAARSAGIFLITEHELIRSLMDFSGYLNQLKDSYRQQFGTGTDSWYINASANRQGEIISDLDVFVDEWLNKETKAPLAVLGGYGTGKTSFCLHYANHLIETSTVIVPFIISLRDSQHEGGIKALIREVVKERCIDSDIETFWRLYHEGFVLLMLDGFDEMSSHVDSDILERNLLEIEQFAKIRGNVILTCRPEFFITDHEQERALHPSTHPLSDRFANYDSLELALWDNEQISRYVNARVAQMNVRKRPKYFLDRIENLEELRDMATRAVHLDLIVKTLPAMVEKNVKFTRTNLYRTYLMQEMGRETIYNKRLRLITDAERLALLETVIERQSSKGSIELTFDSAQTTIRSTLHPPEVEIEPITRDFLNRSFLKRNGHLYAFAHKSLGEYLLAVALAKQLRTGSKRLLNKLEFSWATAGMVLDLFGGLEAFDTFLDALDIGHFDHVQAQHVRAIFFAASALADLDKSAQTIGFQKQKKGSRGKQKDWRLRALSIIDKIQDALAAVLGYCQLYRRRTQRRRDYLKIIDEQWRRTLTLIRELQDYQLKA